MRFLDPMCAFWVIADLVINVVHCLVKFRASLHGQILANLREIDQVKQICSSHTDLRESARNARLKAMHSSRKCARKCSKHAILWECAKSAKGYLPVIRSQYTARYFLDWPIDLQQLWNFSGKLISGFFFFCIKCILTANVINLTNILSSGGKIKHSQSLHAKEHWAFKKNQHNPPPLASPHPTPIKVRHWCFK